jgi:hypothetical protein
MKKRFLVAAAIALFGVSGVAYAAARFHQVNPGEYDPAKTHLVNGAWLAGIGCPTAADVAEYPATSPTTTYSDPACLTGDSRDKKNEGLLLAKTGPTSNNAEPFVELKNLKGVQITELGYDLRKVENTSDPRGSTCSVQAPMFQLQTKDGDVYYIGCNAPPPDLQTAGDGYLRLRWGGTAPLQGYLNGNTLLPITGMAFDKVFIVFQDGYVGPTTADQSRFGLAVLDNIDVNGVLVGEGPTDPN